MKNHANKIQFLKIERCRFLDDYYAQFESRTEKAKAAQEIQVVGIFDFRNTLPTWQFGTIAPYFLSGGILVG